MVHSIYRYIIMYCGGGLLLLCSFSLQSQNIDGGLVAGFNFTQIDGDAADGYHKIGLNVGPRAEIDFSKNIKGQMELLFTQKGSSSGFSNQNNYSQWRIAIDYIEIPVVLDFRLNQIINLQTDQSLYLGAGLAPNYLLQLRTYDGNGLVEKNGNPDNLNQLELVANLEYMFNEHWGANFRFNYSIIAMGNIRYTLRPDYNNSLTLRLMYLL